MGYIKSKLLNKQIDKEKMQSSRDYKEITFSITLLAAIFGVSLKIIDYYNSNIIILNIFSRDIFHIIVSILLVEFFMIFIFLVFKGFLVSQKYRNKKLNFFLEETFSNIFLISVILIAFVFLTSLYGHIFQDISQNMALTFIYTFLIIIVIVFLIIYLEHGINIIDEFKNFRKTLVISPEKRLILLVKFRNATLKCMFPFILLLVVTLLGFPSLLLSGSLSIEEFPKSFVNTDIMTFSIKETGIPSDKNDVNLYKMNANDSNIFQFIDSITINNTQETLSENRLILGINHKPGAYYLNVNISSLQPGNYLLHSKVTTELYRTERLRITNPVIEKHKDKLFFIAPRNNNFSFNSIT